MTNLIFTFIAVHLITWTLLITLPFITYLTFKLVIVNRTKGNRLLFTAALCVATTFGINYWNGHIKGPEIRETNEQVTHTYDARPGYVANVLNSVGMICAAFGLACKTKEESKR